MQQIFLLRFPRTKIRLCLKAEVREKNKIRSLVLRKKKKPSITDDENFVPTFTTLRKFSILFLWYIFNLIFKFLDCDAFLTTKKKLEPVVLIFLFDPPAQLINPV